MYGFTHAIYRVYPTYVGMIRSLAKNRELNKRLSHVCGNDSRGGERSSTLERFIPRMWE